MDKSQDSAECVDHQSHDASARELEELFSRPEKLAELIGQLRHRVAVSNDPAMRAVLQELEAATNMTAARRVMGGVMMHVDSRYPAPDVYAEAIGLIGAVPPAAGYGIGQDSEREWKRTLDHHEWHRQKTFLAASIQHCRWFSGHLSGEPGREKDAFAFRKLGEQLSRLEKKEQARRRGRDDRQIAAKAAGRPRNKAVNGSVLRKFRLLFDNGQRSQRDFASRVLKVKPYAVKTAEAGFASPKIIDTYLAAKAPNGKKLTREEIENN